MVLPVGMVVSMGDLSCDRGPGGVANDALAFLRSVDDVLDGDSDVMFARAVDRLLAGDDEGGPCQGGSLFVHNVPQLATWHAPALFTEFVSWERWDELGDEEMGAQWWGNNPRQGVVDEPGIGHINDRSQFNEWELPVIDNDGNRRLTRR